MLEKIVKVVNDFQTMYDSEKTKLNREIKRIEDTYNPMAVEYSSTKMEAIKTFNEKVEPERAAAIEKIHEYAKSDIEALADITSKPVPSDAVATVELLKAGDPEQLSEFEVKSIIEKYKGNYLATKIIVQITNAKERFGISCGSADFIIKEIHNVEEMACRMVRQYNGAPTYEQALVLNGKIIMNINEQVQNFLNFNYC